MLQHKCIERKYVPAKQQSRQPCERPHMATGYPELAQTTMHWINSRVTARM